MASYIIEVYTDQTYQPKSDGDDRCIIEIDSRNSSGLEAAIKANGDSACSSNPNDWKKTAHYSDGAGSQGDPNAISPKRG